MKLVKGILIGALATSVACGSDDNTENPDDCFKELDYFSAAATNNLLDVDPMLTAATNRTAPDFKPMANAPVLTPGGTPPAGFDTSATFVGAIGTTDWTAGWTSYPEGVPANLVSVNAGATTQEVTQTWLDANAANLDWTNDTTYILKEEIFVTGTDTLSIQSGTVIRGENGSALVIARGAKIDASGTSAEPIVFTSSKDTGAASGDWGGVVLLGAASINVEGGVDNIEGFAADTANTEYGGTDDAHSCGSLKYVRIEYAGFEFGTDNELNGLTVGGCGSATTLDYVQVHAGLDDGIEFFGGTAPLTHAVITSAQDDSLDWDAGWRGNVQFLIVQQGAVEGDRAMESDNNGNNNDATPRSNPTIWNATYIGNNDAGSIGWKARRGTAGSINNAIFMNFGLAAIDVDSLSSRTQAEEGNLTTNYTYFYENGQGGEQFPEDDNDCKVAE